MKKLTLGLAVLLSGVTNHSFAAIFSGTFPFGVCVPSLCGGFNVGATGYWWQPSIHHQDYALVYPFVIPPTPPSLTFPPNPFRPLNIVFDGGRYHDVDLKHRGGYRINVGYIFPCTGNDINLAFTHWDHDEGDNIDGRGLGAIIPTLADTFNGTILFPGSDFIFDFAPPFIPASLADIFAFFDTYALFPLGGGVPVDNAVGFSDTQYQAFDLEFGQYISFGCNLRMRWFGGIRWATLRHKFRADYSGALVMEDLTDFFGLDPLLGESANITLDARITLSQKSDYRGIGPRLGWNTTYAIPCTGLGLVAEASISLLVGEISSRFGNFIHRGATLTETLFDPDLGFLSDSITIVQDQTENFHHHNEPRIVPNLEGKLGVDYSYVFCNRSKFTIEVGYMITHYYNITDRLSEIGEATPEFHTRHTMDVGFEGGYVSLQYQL